MHASHIMLFGGRKSYNLQKQPIRNAHFSCC